MTSNMLVRVMRATRETGLNAMHTTGRTISRQLPTPQEAGNHPRWRQKISIDIRATQKPGAAEKMTANVVAA